ncbi:methyltransferase type 11 [Actinokineospora fastidiosa]|uniref:Methyltransferase type 11 n=2 Tax=Actinokineospora fastidiosa TaxID=1816 RepID=A0A918GBX4_9PSEU|nr:methyltransferase type 11 [Actinokineospora fastidiosa]
MPTLSGEPHRQRSMAESFGVDVERYDRTRPPYPDALVERVVAHSPGRAVLDVGCGTGIATRQFRAAGCAVLGVDPDERMAAFARRGGIAVEVAAFEAWDPAGRVFDAVVAGQSWHWVDPVAGAAAAARTLRPGGLLAVFWHVPHTPPDITDALAAALPDMPRPAEDGYRTLDALAADGIKASGAFTEPRRWTFDWQRDYTRAQWLDQLPTSGLLTRLPPQRLAAALDGVGAAIDALGGAFTLPYTTVAVTAAVPGGQTRPR